jgi:hypothetical protein
MGGGKRLLSGLSPSIKKLGILKKYLNETQIMKKKETQINKAKRMRCRFELRARKKKRFLNSPER